MTTDKQVVDSLTTQGKTTSQEEVPPQTIIGTFDTIESVRDAAVKARARVGFGLGNDILRRYGVKIADLPKDKWQEAGGAEGIIRPGKGGNPGQFEPFTVSMSDLDIDPVAGIIPVVNEVSGKAYSDMVAAEVRRQAVQAEAMVNLAVGVTMMSLEMLTITQPNAPSKLCGGRITITPKDLENFQQKYVVHQEVRNEGDFTIIVSPKEV